MEASKSPDRINITKKARDIISQIDDLHFFDLHDSSVTRSELFLFAMSLGVEAGIPTRLENINPGGLVLEKSIDARTKALIYALYIGQLGGQDLDKITQKDDVYNMAQEYANTGFEILEDYMSTKKDSDLLWTLLEELDSQYSQNFDTKK